jgi:hypothetical protein
MKSIRLSGLQKKVALRWPSLQMRKFVVVVVALTFAITVASISTNAQIKMGPSSATRDSGNIAIRTIPNGCFTLAISNLFVDGNSIDSRPSSWFATFAPSRSMMLVFGACLLLFGAFLRRRPALRRPQSRPAALRETQSESGVNLIPEAVIMAEQNKTASPHVADLSGDRRKREILPAFLATHRSLTDPAISKEHQ